MPGLSLLWIVNPVEMAPLIPITHTDNEVTRLKLSGFIVGGLDTELLQVLGKSDGQHDNQEG